MTKLSIKNDFGDDYISRKAGERLRDIILDSQKEGKEVQVDFSGVIVASTSFFDEGFAKLAEHGWSLEDFESRLELVNINPFDKRVLDEMCRHRGLK